MSYILDALKKSEQQRQAVEPSSVSDRLLVNQAEVRSKTKKWWLVLILGNLLAISLLFWYLVHHKSQPVTPGSNAPIINRAQPSESIDQAPVASQISSSVENEAPPQLNSPSIEEMMATEQPSITSKTGQHQTQTKPIIEKKPVPAKKRMVVPDNARYRRAEYTEEPTMQQARPAQQYYDVPQEPAIPAEPPRSRPKLAINVFGYTQKPEERFVIINMTKYKVGQQVGDGIELKAIHPDYIELRQGNVNFKMQRP